MKTIKMSQFITMLLVVLVSGCKKDGDPGVRPTVISTDPISGFINLPVNSKIGVTFSVAMNPSTITNTTFTLQQGTSSVPGAVVYAGTTASFTPAANLSPNTVYLAKVTAEAKDLADVSLAKDYRWEFTTGTVPDLTQPTVTLTDPLNNATAVALNHVIAATFSETMNLSTITSLTFTLKKGSVSVLGAIAYSGTTATFAPTNSLVANEIYTATITTGAKDVAGNALATNTVWSFSTLGVGPTGVNLGLAVNYVILAKTAISNIPTSAITGNLGLSPAATSFVTGFGLTNATGYATAPEITGKIYATDMAAPTGINLTTAVSDMMTAYTDAAGRPTPDFSELSTGNIGGQTLPPGLYKWTNTVTLPSSATISGGANDIWIFQIAGDLTVSNAVNVTLTGGVQAKNIFWQVAGTVTIGTGSHFEGIILSQTGITFQTGASMNGRALAQTAVILDGNAITNP